MTRTALMLNLTPALAELLRPQTHEPYRVSLLSSCRSGLAAAPPGWRAVVSPRFSPELMWAAAASVSRLCGCCFLKSKRGAACRRMGATSTPDSGMAGQAVKGPQLPERLRPHTARVAMCAGPDPARPLPEGRAASGKWLPYLGPWFFHLRMEGFHLLGRVAMDTGQGRGACFLQFPAEALWA